MLKWRLFLGTAIVLTLIGLCFLDAQSDLPAGMQAVHVALPGVALMPVLLVLTVLATQEVLRLARSAGYRPAAAPIYVGNVLLVLAQWLPALNIYWLQNRFPGDEFDYMPHVELIHAASQSALWALAFGVLMLFVAEMRRFQQPGRALGNLAVGVFCLIYVGMMCTFVVQMRLFWGVGAVASWIITVKMGDIGAYTIGRLFGRTRMVPTISPGKTMEGAMGAVAFACAGSWISFHGVNWIKIPWFSHWIHFHGMHLPAFSHWVPLPAVAQFAPPSVALPPGTVGGWLVFGVLMGVVGILGDLAESLLKRDVGCKDSSSWMPGFGGVLDILDSLLLTAPLAWICWAMGIVGGGQGM